LAGNSSLYGGTAYGGTALALRLGHRTSEDFDSSERFASAVSVCRATRVPIFHRTYFWEQLSPTRLRATKHWGRVKTPVSAK